MTASGNVKKSEQGWKRFQARTNHGKNKRLGFRPLSAHRPKGGRA